MRSLTSHVLAAGAAGGPPPPESYTYIHGLCVLNAQGERIDQEDATQSFTTAMLNRDMLGGGFVRCAFLGLPSNRGTAPGATEEARFTKNGFRNSDSVSGVEVCIVLTPDTYLINAAAGRGENEIINPTRAHFRIWDGTGYTGTSRTEAYESPVLDGQPSLSTWANIRATQWYSQADWLAVTPTSTNMVEVTVTDRSGEGADATGVCIEAVCGDGPSTRSNNLCYLRVYRKDP